MKINIAGEPVGQVDTMTIGLIRVRSETPETRGPNDIPFGTRSRSHFHYRTGHVRTGTRERDSPMEVGQWTDREKKCSREIGGYDGERQINGKVAEAGRGGPRGGAMLRLQWGRRARGKI